MRKDYIDAIGVATICGVVLNGIHTIGKAIGVPVLVKMFGWLVPVLQPIVLTLFVSTGIWIALDTPAQRFKKKVYKSLEGYNIQLVKIKKLRKQSYGYYAEAILPVGLTFTKFKNSMEGIEQETGTKIKVEPIKGPLCSIKFSTVSLSQFPYVPKPASSDDLAIPLATPFGPTNLNFSDESSCHLLVGGATRMGKSVFLRLLTTHLLCNTNGNIRFVLVNNKVTDLYMFRNIPQIQIAESLEEARDAVSAVLQESYRRKALLKSKRDVVDLKQFRKKYPHENVQPIFVVIDEYGRFAEDRLFQEMVTEIAETAGYLDIHLVISAQRPDAKDVLKPRIKANILTRLAFTTTDEYNSNIILGISDACKLGGQKGRAILLDGSPTEVQVPYLSEAQAEQILQPFYRKEDEDADSKGQENTGTVEEVQSAVTDALREFSLP